MAKSSLLEAINSADGLVSVGRSIDYSGAYDVLGTGFGGNVRIQQIGQSSASGNSMFSPEDLINLNFVLDGNWIADTELKLVKTGSQFFGGTLFQKEGKIGVAIDDKTTDGEIKNGVLKDKSIVPCSLRPETLACMQIKTGGEASDVYAGIAIPQNLLNQYIKHYYPNQEWNDQIDGQTLRKEGLLFAEVIFKNGSTVGKVFTFPVIGEWNPSGNGDQFVLYFSAPLAATDDLKKANMSLYIDGKTLYSGELGVIPDFSYNSSNGKTGMTVKTLVQLANQAEVTLNEPYNERTQDCYVRFVVKDKDKVNQLLKKTLDEELYKSNGSNVRLRPAEISYGGSATIGTEMMWLGVAVIGAFEGSWNQCENPNDNAGVTFGHFSYTTAHQGKIIAQWFSELGEVGLAQKVTEISGQKLGKNSPKVQALIAAAKSSGVLNDPRFHKLQIDTWMSTYLKNASLWWKAQNLTSRLTYAFACRAILQTGGTTPSIHNSAYIGNDYKRFLPADGNLEKEKSFLISCTNAMINKGRGKYGGWVNEANWWQQMVNTGNLNPDVFVSSYFGLNYKWGTIPGDMGLYKDYMEQKAKEFGII